MEQHWRLGKRWPPLRPTPDRQAAKQDDADTSAIHGTPPMTAHLPMNPFIDRGEARTFEKASKSSQFSRHLV
jgi:hypothetical protein